MASNGSFVSDLRKFLMQGDVVNLATAVIIGGAFGKIVSALVEKFFMPLLGLILPGGDWKQWMIPLGGTMMVQDPAKPAGTLKEVAKGLYFGEIMSEVINFLAIATVVFLILRAIENAKKRFRRQEAIDAIESPSTEQVMQERMVSSMERLADALDRQPKTTT
jgi:large conductance mechanosensitive channel